MTHLYAATAITATLAIPYLIALYRGEKKRHHQ